MPQYERMYPFSSDMEAALLCSMVWSAESRRECLKLNEKVFYIPAHQIIFVAIRDLDKQNLPPDFHLLKHHLKSQAINTGTLLDEVGGSEYLNQVFDATPLRENNWGDNWKHYRSFVLDYATRREVIDRSERIAAKARDVRVQMPMEEVRHFFMPGRRQDPPKPHRGVSMRY